MGFLNKRIWLLLFATVLLSPSVARAHAHLLRSDPADGARLSASPGTVHLSFSERPELSMSFAELKDAKGTTYSLGRASRGDSDRLGVDFSIHDSLPPGRYTLSWRTAAADGHPSHGQIKFEVLPNIGSPTNAAAQVMTDSAPVAGLSPESEQVSHAGDDDRAASIPNSIGRMLLFLGLLVVIGVVTFALVILPNAAGVNQASRETMLARASIAGVVAAVLVIAAALLRLYLEATMMENPMNYVFIIRNRGMRSKEMCPNS